MNTETRLTARIARIAWCVLALGALVGSPLIGQTAPAPAGKDTTKSLKPAVEKAIQQGLAFLRSRYDEKAGCWTVPRRGPDAGINAIVLQAFAGSPKKYTVADHPFLARAVDYLTGLAKPDGAIHDGHLYTYKTSAAIQALARLDPERHAKLVDRGRLYLIGVQLDEAEGYEESDENYGGTGYGPAGKGKKPRPDLSNLSTWTDGLLAAGEKPGSAPFKRALLFLERCQNNSEVNTIRQEADGKVVVSGNDGGGVYRPGFSGAGFTQNKDDTVSPRAYGSMTYALLKGYIAADLPPDDARVKKALEWLANHFTVDENPGFDKSRNPDAGWQGLFYYYHTMARALELWSRDTVRDRQGRERKWREELARKLLSLQNPDGSWKNEKSQRWWEGMPELATSYALIALEICHQGL